MIVLLTGKWVALTVVLPVIGTSGSLMDKVCYMVRWVSVVGLVSECGWVGVDRHVSVYEDSSQAWLLGFSTLATGMFID